MIKEKDFKKNVKAILDAGAIENIPIKQLNILKLKIKPRNNPKLRMVGTKNLTGGKLC